MKKSDLKLILAQYENQKGILKGCLTQNSGAMEELSSLYNKLNEYKEDDQIPGKMISTIQEIVNAHLTDVATSHWYIHATTAIFIKLKSLIDNPCTKALGGNLVLWMKINSYLPIKDTLKFSLVNKEMKKLGKYNNFEMMNLSVFQKSARHSRQTVGVALLLTLNEYKIDRDNRYKLKDLFYVDKDFVTRVQEFKSDIQILIDTKSDEERQLSPFLGYQFLHDRLNKDNSAYFIHKDHYCRKSFEDFPFSFSVDQKSVPEKEQSKDLYLLWRLAIEISYATQKKDSHYHEMLIKMAKIIFLGRQNSLVDYYDKVISAARQMQAEFKEPKNWNLCYVWSGGDLKYQLHEIQDPSDGESKYSTGRVVVFRDVYQTGPVGWGGGSTTTTADVIDSGVEARPKFFHPFREKHAEFENLINIFEHFIKNILQCDFRQGVAIPLMGRK